MIKSLLRVLVISCAGGLAACSTLFGEDGSSKGGDEYRYAEAIEPIDAPAESRSRLQEIFVVPDVDDSSYDVDEKFSVPRPQSLSSSLLEEKVKIQKLSGDQWIFVSNSPSEVWPQVVAFLGTRNMTVAKTDAASGIIETSWLQFNDTKEKRERFLLRIENGVQPDSSEIHILHMSESADEPILANKSWPEVSSEAAKEAWMVDDLSNVLAANLERSSSSLLAQTIGGDDKANIEASEGGEPVLRLKLSYVRAWASVLGAMDDDGFHLWDRENTLGVMYVSYIEPEDADSKPNWFVRLYRSVKGWFSARKTGATPTTPYDLDKLLQHLPDTEATQEVFTKIENQGAPLEDIPGYLLIVRGVDKDIEVRLRDGQGQRLSEKEAKMILGVMRKNLI